MELECVQRRHEQFLKQNLSDIKQSIEFQDASALYNEMEQYRMRQSEYKRSLEEKDLIEFIDDFTFEYDKKEAGAEYEENQGDDNEETDFNNNDSVLNGEIFLQKDVSETAGNLSADVEGVINILQDLDICLENSVQFSPKDSIDVGKNALNNKMQNNYPSVRSSSSEQAGTSNSFFTPPLRHTSSFCNAVDSVLVNKKRLSGSHIDSDLCHGEEKSIRSGEKVSKSLEYNGCEFVGLSQVAESDGHVHFVQKPNKVHTLCPPKFSSSTPCTEYKNSYLASLNKSGNLSPFMKSIAGKYDLFDPYKKLFKKYDLNIVDSSKPDNDSEASYGSFMFGHHAGVEILERKPPEVKKVAVDDAVGNASPGINRMFNNYVYEVLIGRNRAVGTEQAVGLSASDIELRSSADVDSSMAVCFDDSSNTISKDDLSDESAGLLDGDPRNIMISIYEEACPTVLVSTKGADKTIVDMSMSRPDAIETDAKRQALLHDLSVNPKSAESISALITLFEKDGELKEDDYKPDKYPPVDIIHKPKFVPYVTAEGRRQTIQQSVEMNWKVEPSLPGGGRLRQHLSYCRIPFSTEAPMFWFSKDFEMSPPSKARVRSPKRSCSDIKACSEKDKFQDVLNSYHLSPGLGAEHWSPAKKRRRHTVDHVSSLDQSVVESNVNSNALVQLPLCSEDMGNVETFFGKEFVSETCKRGHVMKQRVSSAEVNRTNSGPLKSRIGEYKNLPSSVRVETPSKVRPDQLFFSETIETSSVFMDVCSEKRRKRAFFGKGKSRSSEVNCPVRLLNYKKLEETSSSKCLRHGEIHRRSSDTHYSSHLKDNQLKSLPLKNLPTFKYDYMFCLHPDSLTKLILEPPHYFIHPAKNCQIGDQNESTVGVFFQHGNGSEDDEDFQTTPCKNKITHAVCEETKVQASEFSEKNCKDLDNVNDRGNTQHLEGLFEGRNKLYSAISAAVEACSEIVKDSSQHPDRLLNSNHSSRNNLDDITPDPELLVTDLQGLDLSETPKYASANTVDNEMKAVLNEALDSLDNIMSESFSFSAESPLKEENRQASPKANNLHVADLKGFTGTDDEIELAIVGNKCILHEYCKVDSEKVIMPDMSDSSIELHNDSILNVEGTSCVLHDQEQQTQYPLYPIVTVKHLENNYPDFDEAHEVEEKATFQMSGNDAATNVREHWSGREPYKTRFCEKQPSYFCMDFSDVNSALKDEEETGPKEIGDNVKRVSTMNEIQSLSQYLNLSRISSSPSEQSGVEDLEYSRSTESDVDEALVDEIIDYSEDSSIEEALTKHVDRKQLDEEELGDIQWIDEENEMAASYDEGPLDVTRGSSQEEDFEEYEKK